MPHPLMLRRTATGACNRVLAGRKRSFRVKRAGLAKDDRGGALAEMAILLIPFMLLFAIVIEGGNILWRHQIAQKAARDAARYLSRVQPLVDPGCTLDNGAIAAASATARTLGVTGRLDGLTPLIPGWSGDNIILPPPIIVTTDPCTVVVRAGARVDVPLPFSPVRRLFDPTARETLSFTVGDQARWVGE